MNRYIHLVCLEAPAPPDYGGAIDMFYKIKALGETGAKIILHYFSYKNNRGVEGLEAFCDKIISYPRKQFFLSDLRLPFIVGSRINSNLIKNLNADKHPVILEGFHTAGLIPFLDRDKDIVIRVHNDEAIYYKMLATAERSLIRRKYFQRESEKLLRFQDNLPKDIPMAFLSRTDEERFISKGFLKTAFIPCFIPWKLNRQFSNDSLADRFCLYHGNLAVSENEEAAIWLMQEVFSGIDARLIIAGSGMTPRLKDAAHGRSRIHLMPDLPKDELEAIIASAHVHVLPSMNATGVKLKLLHALLRGKFCITNSKGSEGSDIDQGLSIAESAADWQELIIQHLATDFSMEISEQRKAVEEQYDNLKNALKLNELY